MLFASKDASEERLPRVKAPALVLMGSQDPDFKQPEAEAQWVANSLHARYAIVPGAGHYPHAEMPDITGPLALLFVQSAHEPGKVSHGA
jgi:pimeloyl-ACP methyl ester carboxylesterase